MLEINRRNRLQSEINQNDNRRECSTTLKELSLSTASKFHYKTKAWHNKTISIRIQILHSQMHIVYSIYVSISLLSRGSAASSCCLKTCLYAQGTFALGAPVFDKMIFNHGQNRRRARSRGSCCKWRMHLEGILDYHQHPLFFNQTHLVSLRVACFSVVLLMENQCVILLWSSKSPAGLTLLTYYNFLSVLHFSPLNFIFVLTL